MKSKIHNYQRGFALVEGLLVVLVTSVVGFGGYYVWHTQKQNSSMASKVTIDKNIPNNQQASKNATNPYAGWKTYTLKFEKLTFRYPSSWTLQDDSGNAQTNPGTDSVTLTAADGFTFSLDDGWNGGGDSLNFDYNTPQPVTFAGNNNYVVFLKPRAVGGPPPTDANDLISAVLMANPTNPYSNSLTTRDIAKYFPQDKNAHGDPAVNNGGSTMLIGFRYSPTKDFTTTVQAESDTEYKNAVLVLESAHY